MAAKAVPINTVVLLDINMPGMSGVEVAKRIRQQSILKDIVLIAMTGHGDDEDRQRSIEAGFDFHLVKPADMKNVDEILAKLPDRSTAIKARCVHLRYFSRLLAVHMSERDGHGRTQT